MNTSLAQTSQQGAIPDTIDQPRPKGDAVRACIGRQAYETYVDQFCGGGLNFGYSYADPPIIASDGENGARAHHVRLQPIHGPGMPHAASVAARRAIAVRRVRTRFHVAAI